MYFKYSEMKMKDQNLILKLCCRLHIIKYIIATKKA